MNEFKKIKQIFVLSPVHDLRIKFHGVENEMGSRMETQGSYLDPT